YDPAIGSHSSWNVPHRCGIAVGIGIVLPTPTLWAVRTGRFFVADNDKQREVNKLVEGVLSGRINRRQLMRRAAALGITVPGVLMMHAAPDVAAQDATPAANVKTGGSLRAIVVDDPKYLDIHVTQLAQSRNVMASIYETLTVLDGKDGQIKGLLAKEWTFTEPTKLDMTLQEGVTFHKGQDFTAEDVKFTIEYVLNPMTGSPNNTILSAIDNVEVLEPLKVRFNLKSFWPALPSDLTTIQIYSKEATIATISTSPNGTGPFVWTEWAPGDHITLKKNPNYWQAGLPYLDEVIFRPVKEKATSLAIMEAGDAELFFTPDYKDKETIDGNPNLRTVPSVLNDSGYILYVNNSRPPMSDQNVRLAAAYALDRQTYFDAFFSSQGTKNTSPWTKSHWAYNPINDTAFEYDLDKAKSYLEAAGYKDGKSADGTQLSINLVYPKGYPEWRQGSEMYQAAFGEIGVDVKVEELELSTWIDRIISSPDYDLSWDFHFQRAVDPAWTLSLAFFYPPGPQNISQYKDDEITKLIQEGGSTDDQAVRKPIYDRFQERWNEISPGLIVGEYPLFHATQAYVKDFYTQPLFFQDFTRVWLDK
ncbi:MAG: peptide/nickel transport system substrate-binding protein, partial [Thermomicrobiales bacterium]|nr:peptide/nickel transport system substrate-binding protein [Thermomicrobiales bacterium]